MGRWPGTAAPPPPPAPVKRTVPPPAPVGPVTPRTFWELLVGSAAWTSAMTTCSPSVSPVRISASPPPTAPTVTVFSVTAPLVRTPTRAEPEVTPGTAETGTVSTSDDDAVVIVVVAYVPEARVCGVLGKVTVTS